MKIAFVWSGGGEFWNYNSLERGIGGSKAMMIFYAREMARRGHEVHCYSPCRGGGVYNGVHWHQWAWWGQDAYDVAISIRNPIPLSCVDAPVKVFWANDQRCDTLPLAVEERMVNLVVFISAYQKVLYAQHYPDMPKTRNVVLSAGVDWEAYNPIWDNKDPYLCIHNSTPERGLKYLLDMWPTILEAVPEAKLRITSGFQLYGWSDERAVQGDGRHYLRVPDMPNAEYLGTVPRSRLVVLQHKASIMLYPATYDEMCCIAALEAMAAGCPVVTTDRGALSERVRHSETGFLVKGDPASPAYQEQFIAHVIELLDDHGSRAAMGMVARDSVMWHSYTTQGRILETILDELLNDATG